MYCLFIDTKQVSEMNTPPKITELEIHKKLRIHQSSWSYMHAIGPHETEANYEFRTIHAEKIEHAVYKRHGCYFILVDFFLNYESANEEAKAIIDLFPNLKSNYI